MGESYDARRELDGWDAPGYDVVPNANADDCALVAGEPFADPGMELNAMRGPTVKRIQEIQPIAEPREIKQWPISKWIFDLGQNMVGRVRLKISGPAGTTITLRHAEMLNPDGTLYTTNLRRARQHRPLHTQRKRRRDLRATLHLPRLSLRRGERLPWAANARDDHRHRAALRHAADGRLRMLRPADQPAAAQHPVGPARQLRGCAHRLPAARRTPRLDRRRPGVHPHRGLQHGRGRLFHQVDARPGGRPVARMATYPTVVPKPGFAGEDGGPAWADAGIICPWTIYQCYGDTRLLEEHYDSMRRFVGFLAETSRDGIRCYPEYEGWHGFGDWLALDGSEGREGGTPKDLIGTAFFAHSARSARRGSHVCWASARTPNATRLCSKMCDGLSRTLRHARTGWSPVGRRPPTCWRCTSICCPSDARATAAGRAGARHRAARYASLDRLCRHAVHQLGAERERAVSTSPTRCCSRRPGRRGSTRSHRALPPSGSAGTAGRTTKASRTPA